MQIPNLGGLLLWGQPNQRRFCLLHRANCLTGLDQIIDHGRYDMRARTHTYSEPSFGQSIEVYGTENVPERGHKTRTNERAENQWSLLRAK